MARNIQRHEELSNLRPFVNNGQERSQRLFSHFELTRTSSLIALSCAKPVDSRLDLYHRQQVSRGYRSSAYTIVYLARRRRISGKLRKISMPETDTEAWETKAAFATLRSEIRTLPTGRQPSPRKVSFPVHPTNAVRSCGVARDPFSFLRSLVCLQGDYSIAPLAC